MRYTILRWPVWQRGVLIGFLWVATMTLAFRVVIGSRIGPALAGSLVGGAMFVTVVTMVMARAEKLLNPVAGRR